MIARRTALGLLGGLAGRAVVGGIVVVVRAHAPPAPGHPPHGLSGSGPQAALAAGHRRASDGRQLPSWPTAAGD